MSKKKQPPIKVTWSRLMEPCDQDTIFTSWWDFADFLKENEVQRKAGIVIYRWEYVRG